MKKAAELRYHDIHIKFHNVTPGVDKTKNNSGASPFFLQIRAKKTMNLKAPGKSFQAPWRPGALYLSTPASHDV
jgi:hypothetical protein